MSNSMALRLDLFNWTPITSQFFEACEELSLGELLHDDLFGLFEAMSAIEMMDPKMDAGMICNRSSAQPLNFQTALAAEHLKIKDLTFSEQIAIFDTTLACFVTWLEGHSLAQTVFTNLYLHQPHDIEDPLIKAVAIVTLKLVDIVKDFIARGCVFEEEDFQPLVYGFKLATEITEQRAGGMLREVEDEIQKVLRSTKSKEGCTRDAETLKKHEDAGALFSRLRFLRLFYLGLVSLYKQDVPEGQKQLAAAKDQIPNIMATINAGLVPDKGTQLIGFEPLANQRLLPPTFPRYTEIKERREGLEYLRNLVDRLLTATSITQLNTFNSIMEFFMDYSSSGPCVLSRSVLQVLYQPLNNYSLSRPPLPSGAGLKDLLKDACRGFNAPPALILKTPPFNSKQIKDCIDSFFCQCRRPLGMLLQTFGHNRARQRDKIATLLEEFATVQEEADKLDTMLNAVCSQTDIGGASRNSHMLFFSTWLLYYVLRLMVRYLLSGFELELYSLHEFPYIYWYLYELLYPWLTTCLHRADTYLLEHEQQAELQRSAGKNKKKIKNNSKRKARPYAKEITFYQGYAIMCSGYYKLMVALKKDERILIPCRQFENEGVRYEHRFAPFANLLTPPLMPYSQYLEVYDHTVSSDSPSLFLSASRDFARARQIFETVSGQDEEMASLITVNKNNFVAVGVLAKADPSRKVSFEFGIHNTFPSVKFV